MNKMKFLSEIPYGLTVYDGDLSLMNTEEKMQYDMLLER